MSEALSEAICCNEGPRRFLEDYETVARPIVHRSNQAYWAFSCTGEPKHQDTIQEMEEAFSDLHASERVHAEITGWLDQPPVDPLVHRQLQLLFREYRRAQAPETLRKRIIKLSLKVEETVSLFRPEFLGQRIEANQLDRILLEEEDEKLRRAAWTATRQVGARILNPTRELVALRNELAQHLGFSDYFGLALDDEEMEVGFSDSILDELLDASEEPWNDTKSALDQELAALRSKAADQLQPWDYTDRFLQSIPRADRRLSMDGWFEAGTIRRFSSHFYRRIGLPIDELWARSDMMPRDGKYPHAFCIGIDNPDDVRVLCNLDGTTRWMDTTLHEYGHALYNSHVDPELPWLLRDAAHTFVTEAVAMYFGRHARDPAWLEQIVGVPTERTEMIGAMLGENQIAFCRWAMVVTLFERAMYADPDQDLNSLWWSLVERIQGLRRPEEHDLPDWASKVHIPCFPAYYQNYIFGELLASQFRNAIMEEHGSDPGVLLSPEVGSFFKDLFRTGRSLPWDETVRKAVGRDLSVDCWVRQFSRSEDQGSDNG